jgi:hypothetical protein
MTEQVLNRSDNRPNKPGRSRKLILAVVVAIALIIGVSITVVIFEPWKRVADLPDSVGTLSIRAGSGFDVPMSVDQGIVPGRNLFFDAGADWTNRRYQDQAAKDQPVYVFIAVLDNPNPEARVAEFFRVIQDPEESTGANSFALGEIESFGGWGGSGYPSASGCGGQSINAPADASQLAFGERFFFTKLVICSWADLETAGIAVFLNRSMESSVVNLRTILAAAY